MLLSLLNFEAAHIWIEILLYEHPHKLLDCPKTPEKQSPVYLTRPQVSLDASAFFFSIFGCLLHGSKGWQVVLWWCCRHRCWGFEVIPGWVWSILFAKSHFQSRNCLWKKAWRVEILILVKDIVGGLLSLEICKEEFWNQLIWRMLVSEAVHGTWEYVGYVEMIFDFYF